MTIKENAPDGATHYNPRNGDYVVFIGGLIQQWFLMGDGDLLLYPPYFLFELKPL